MSIWINQGVFGRMIITADFQITTIKFTKKGKRCQVFGEPSKKMSMVALTILKRGK